MPRLAKSWKVFIGFFLFLEILSPFLLDYANDPIGSIIAIHLFPLVAIVLIVIFGR
jgi:hypothetical protein